jgi:tetratricopeptide (TPR) repeat protein
LRKETLEICRHHFGPEHRSTLDATYRYADILNAVATFVLRNSEASQREQVLRQAIALMEPLLEKAPDNPAYRDTHGQLCCNLVQLITESGSPGPARASEALAYGKKAAELLPLEAAGWQALGQALYRAGEWQECLNALDKAATLGGDAAWNCFFRAMANHKLGNHPEAQRCYDQARQWIISQKQQLDQNPALREELSRFDAETRAELESKED